MKKWIYITLLACSLSCADKQPTEKHQDKRDNIIHVNDQIKEIEIEEVLIGNLTRSYVMDDYLIICDVRGWDKLIHIFNKKDFSYLSSTAEIGQGPGEIAIIGHIGINEKDRVFYVSDHGKQRIFSYALDSVLTNPYYLPEEKMKMDERQFPSDYIYVNDTLCIGRIIEPIGNNDFKPMVGKWNMTTGEIRIMPYEHPEVEKKRMTFDASIERGVYVECHSLYDLMTICDLDGNFRYNVYGKNWKPQKLRELSFYGSPVICGDKILVPYSGKVTFIKSNSGGVEVNLPTKILAFTLNGDYIQTLETGYLISNMCYDKDNNRLVLDLNDEIQFAYLDLDGIL